MSCITTSICQNNLPCGFQTDLGHFLNRTRLRNQFSFGVVTYDMMASQGKRKAMVTRFCEKYHSSDEEELVEFSPLKKGPEDDRSSSAQVDKEVAVTETSVVFRSANKNAKGPPVIVQPGEELLPLNIRDSIRRSEE